MQSGEPVSLMDEVRMTLDFPYFAEEVLGYKFATFHKEQMNAVSDGRNRYVFIISPRGHLKTTLFSIAYPIWRLYTSRKKNLRICLTSSALDQSWDAMEFVQNKIEENDYLRELMPVHREKAWNKSETTLTNGNKYFVKPFNDTIRGTHVDYYINDDILREEGTTQEQIKTKFWSLITPCIQTRKGQLVVVGTPMTIDDLLHELKEKPDWKGLHYKAVVLDDSGNWMEPLWKERFSLTELREIKRNMGNLLFEREYMCLKPDTLIQMEIGLKQIKDIKIGERVITHMGRVKTVLNVFKSKALKLIEIKTQGFRDYISITLEHPLAIYDNELKWISASKLRKGDFLLMPLLRSHNNLIDSKAIIFGWYVAEGSIGAKNRQVIFYLSSEEKDNIRELEDALKKEGYIPKRYKYRDSSVCAIRVNSVSLVKELDNLFGRGKKKRIPIEILELDEHSSKIFLDSYIKGDGCYEGNDKWSTSSVCLDVSEGIARIASKLDYSISKDFFRQRTSAGGIINGRKIKGNGIFHRVRGYGKSRKTKNYEKYRGYPITDIRISDYVGDVYNLEVEDDNSFTTTMFTVHNCTPLSGEASLFNPQMIEKQKHEDNHTGYREGFSYFIGVDVALSKAMGDYFVFNIIAKDNKGTCFQVYMERHQTEDSKFLMDRLKSLKKQFNIIKILIEDRGLSKGFLVDALAEEELKYCTENFATTRTNKELLVSHLQAGLTSGRLFILDNPIMIKELLAFGIKKARDGKITYEGLGSHDDTVISLGMAYEAATTKKSTYSLKVIY